MPRPLLLFHPFQTLIRRDRHLRQLVRLLNENSPTSNHEHIPKRGTCTMPTPNRSMLQNNVIDVDAIEDEIQPNPNPSDLEPAELLQPTINIQTQFNLYNKKHFSNKIINTTVEYSTRMTLCAGTCTFRPPNIRIALSEPLLKFRPRSDLLSTLLHEMIHAYLFLTQGLSRDGPDGHGPVFMSHAHRINAAEAGVNITPYHQFQEEVEHYRVHHWRCQKCAHLIKRSMNRPPGPADLFWPTHQQTCGGQYLKIAGPPKKEKPMKPPKNRAMGFDSGDNKDLPKGVMKTFRIDDMLSGRLQKQPVKSVNCPVCAAPVKERDMNKHLDLCLAESICTQPVDPPTQRNDEPHSEENGTTGLQTTYSPKAAPRWETTRLSDRDIAPEPATSKSLPAPREPNRSIRNPLPTTSTKSFDVMKYIADPEALYNLSLAPKKFRCEDVDKIFRELPFNHPEPSQEIPKSGINDFLQSLIHPDSPPSKELQAKAIINALRTSPNDEEFSFHAVCEQLSISWSELHRLIQQNSSTDHHGNIVFSEKVLDMLFPSRPSNVKRTEPGETLKRPRSSSAAVQERLTQPYPKRSRRSDAKPVRPECADVIHGEGDGRQRSDHTNPKKRADATKCPICNINVGEGGLDEHISSCVLGSQEQEGYLAEEASSYEPENVQSSPKAASRSESRMSDTTSDKNQRCPICDIALSRRELEAHVASCMMSTGLADAF